MLTIVRLRIAKRGILHVLFVIGLLSLPLLAGEKPKDAVPPAPVPSPIAAAKKVFISNAPGNNLPAYFGGPDRAYNEFYAAMKGWGRYELVAAPSDADLILEISFTSSLSSVGGTSTSGCISTNYTELRLVILGAKMHVPLWWFNEAVNPKISFGHRPEKAVDSAFSQSTATLVHDLKKLVSEPAIGASDANK
ncbi:MAG: hypothetical protein ACRD23_07570 [Terriglobales bacterium]